ncbi:MAG: PA2169 family four-helix-bundle protein [Burkholderiales bacterium]|nr:PA2169 family four-helix-bundle protein [Burkholderiales bacterium]
MENSRVVSILNDLIETCIDGEEGFRSCADNIRDSEMKAFFSSRAKTCRVAATQLQDLVVSLGGRVESSGSMSATMHRRWLDIKSLITGKSDEAILDECERGEDVAVRRYREALDQDLPEHIRIIVQRQYEGVLQNHDQVRTMRDRVHARHHPH